MKLDSKVITGLAGSLILGIWRQLPLLCTCSP